MRQHVCNHRDHLGSSQIWTQQFRKSVKEAPDCPGSTIPAYAPELYFSQAVGRVTKATSRANPVNRPVEPARMNPVPTRHRAIGDRLRTLAKTGHVLVSLAHMTRQTTVVGRARARPERRKAAPGARPRKSLPLPAGGNGNDRAPFTRSERLADLNFGRFSSPTFRFARGVAAGLLGGCRSRTRRGCRVGRRSGCRVGRSCDRDGGRYGRHRSARRLLFATTSGKDRDGDGDRCGSDNISNVHRRRLTSLRPSAEVEEVKPR